MIDKLDDYEERTFAKFHKKILDDDGIPELISQMRAIKFEIDTIYDVKYKGLKHINIREQAIERFNRRKLQKEKAKLSQSQDQNKSDVL
jgi:hypothetical protein